MTKKLNILRQRKKFSDDRLDGMCCYCGDFPETRDHVPSKVLLNEPYPENLPVVPCCLQCNQDFSTNEEYFACLIECIIHGTTDIEKLSRDKIKRILSKKAHLHKRLTDAMAVNEDGVFFQIDEKAVSNILLKLANGHAKFEVGENQWEAPTFFAYKPLHIMTEKEVENFFALPILEKYPEVGSRLFQQVVLDPNNTPYSAWTVVQDGVYEYLISSNLSQMSVRILIYEYLAVEVIW